MDTFLTIVIIIFLIQLIFKNTFKTSVHQVNISFYGFNKIPKALLELAKINKGQNTSYSELSKDEQGKFDKIHEKILHDAVWCTLTYIDSHDLIHVQKPKVDYFHKVSNDDRYLIHEQLGKLKDGELHYVLYRKDSGWLRGSMLIGYLLKKRTLGEKGEVIPLFKFPERIMRWRYFTKSLQNKYNLKENIVADYIDKDELGYSGGIYMVSYTTENKDGVNFWFRIY